MIDGGKQLQHTYNQYKQLQHYYKQIQIITIIYTAMTKHVINIGEFYNLEKWGAYLGGVSPSPLSPPPSQGFTFRNEILQRNTNGYTYIAIEWVSNNQGGSNNQGYLIIKRWCKVLISLTNHKHIILTIYNHSSLHPLQLHILTHNYNCFTFDHITKLLPEYLLIYSYIYTYTYLHVHIHSYSFIVPNCSLY